MQIKYGRVYKTCQTSLRSGCVGLWWAVSIKQLLSQLVFRCWLSLHLQIRKWKMLGRHHGDSSAKPKESESDVQLCGCQSWGLHPSPLLGSPVMMECSICSGPYIGYTPEDSWQPRQRTQAGSAFLHQIITSQKIQWKGTRLLVEMRPIFLLFLLACPSHAWTLGTTTTGLCMLGSQALKN